MVPLGYLLKFIEEDAPLGDVTSDAIIPEVACRAVIRAEQDGVAAGLLEAAALFSHFGVDVQQDIRDGEPVQTGNVLLSLSGDAKKILLVERSTQHYWQDERDCHADTKNGGTGEGRKPPLPGGRDAQNLPGPAGA